MGDDDKPFACSEPGCGMRFANEDHLSVHKMKHEMSLPLTPGSKPTNLFYVADQTPTPTKFLRNCEEIGLFNELNKNPFEEAFKKAASEGINSVPLYNHVGSSLSVHMRDDLGTLNTPTPNISHAVSHPTPAKVPRIQPEYIPLPGPNCETGSTLDTPTPGAMKSPEPVAPSNEAMDLRVTSQSESETEMPISSTSQPSSILSPTEEDLEVSIMSDSAVSTSSEMSAATAAIKKDNTPSTASTPVVITPPVNEVKQQYLMQVLLQLPGGQTVPVHIPAAIAVTPNGGQAVATSTVTTQVAAPAVSTTATTAAPIAITTTTAPSTVSTSSITKQKLKAAITQNVHQSVLNQNMRVMSEAVERVTAQQQKVAPQVPVPAPTPPQTIAAITQQQANRPQTLLKSSVVAGTSLVKSSAPVTEVQMQAADTSTPFNSKKRKSPEDDQDERRRKFLERNRAAAARCRQKRKSWIVNLEKKADELQNTNSNLQGEVTKLRSEVAQLKSLLLAHKDCPVFLEQRESGQLNLETVMLAPNEIKSESPGPASHLPTQITTITLGGATTAPSVAATSMALVSPDDSDCDSQDMAMDTDTMDPTVLTYVQNDISSTSNNS